MTHEHGVASGVLDGNTFWYCPSCGRTLEGSAEEFPHLTGEALMAAFFEALPE